MDFERVARELEGGARDGAFPGAVVLIARGGRVLYHAAFGARSVDPGGGTMQPDTIFDLSSLTKPLATTTAFMLLVREKKVAPDDRVSRFFHNFGVHGKTHVTFRHLLAHCSGLPGWRPYFRDIERIEREGRLNFIASRGAKEWVYDQVHREKPESVPGTRAVYSDLGFMLLGQAVETISGQGLDRFCRSRIFAPLGLDTLSFVDLSQVRVGRVSLLSERIAATQECPWRRRILCGEVGDENAYAMGGVAGHAGLFGSARDVDALGGVLMKGLRGDDGLLSGAMTREMWARDASIPDSTRTLGWDTPSPAGSSAGSRMSAWTVGHLGFTGTSIWMDLERQIRIVFLTNRVHPDRDVQRIKEFRPLIHDLVMEALA